MRHFKFPTRSRASHIIHLKCERTAVQARADLWNRAHHPGWRGGGEPPASNPLEQLLLLLLLGLGTPLCCHTGGGCPRCL